MADMTILPEALEVEEFFEGIRNPENILVDGYFNVLRKDLPAYANGADNIETAIQIPIGGETEPVEFMQDIRRVYYLRYKNRISESIIDLAFEYIPEDIDRIIFRVSMNFDALIDRAGNLIFLKNRTRGFIQQELINHLKRMDDTHQLPGDTFRKLFIDFEEIGMILSVKLAQDENVVNYYTKLLAEN